MIDRKKPMPVRLVHHLIQVTGNPRVGFGVTTGGLKGMDEEIETYNRPLAHVLCRTLRAWVRAQTPRHQWRMFHHLELRDAIEQLGMDAPR